MTFPSQALILLEPHNHHLTALPHSDYFEIEVRSGQLILTPVRIQRADAVRAKLAELELESTDIEQAVAWARSPQSQSG